MFQTSRLLTVEPAAVCLQGVEKIFVASGSCSLDGNDELSRERGVTVAQLGQLHRKRRQPSTQHLAPSDRSVETTCKTVGVCSKREIQETVAFYST